MLKRIPCPECGDDTGCCTDICWDCDAFVPGGTCSEGYCEECCYENCGPEEDDEPCH